ncbi:MAG: DNA-binding transcriptional regulator OxyR [Acidiferrobacterales bacterium]|nr:DNA-binding transcriptional regulator OxyR [Acidiferrobacterales bacterium]
MVTLKDLQYLVAIDTHRHFSNAAEACFVSQPTLSGQFKKLEEYLGITLVERNRHQIMMTPAGEQLAARAREILAQADEFERHASALLDPLAGDMHLGLVPTVAPYLLSKIMTNLSAALPNIRFYLHEQQTQVLLKKLDQGQLDVLLLPWRDEMSVFDRFDLFEEELWLATPPDHPLQQQDEIQLSDLQGQHVLTLEDGHCLRDDTMHYCFAAGADEDQRFRATSLETLRYMVANGVGITLMPELAILPSESDGVAYKRFSGTRPNRQISAILRQGYPRIACVREIVRVVRSAMEDSGKTARSS